MWETFQRHVEPSFAFDVIVGHELQKELSAEEKKVYLDESKMHKNGKVIIWDCIDSCILLFSACRVYWLCEELNFVYTRARQGRQKNLDKEETNSSPQKKQKKSAKVDKKVNQDTKKKDEENGDHVSNKEDSDDSDADQSY